MDLRSSERQELEAALRGATSSAAGGLPSSGASTDDDQPWRVLIMDAAGRDLVAPFFKVKALREFNITLHLSLDAPRDAVPMVTAVYLCEPTLNNLTRIADDCIALLYENYVVNFTRPVSRKLLETFAERLRPLPTIDHIRVIERPLSFIATTAQCLTLQEQRTLSILNSRSTADDVMDHHLERVAVSVSDIAACCRQPPLVAYLKNGPVPDIAQRVIKRLEDSLRDDLAGSRGGVGVAAAASGGAAANTRPLLVLVDRTIDLLAPLHHPFTYSGLLSDTLSARLGKIDLPAADVASDAAAGEKGVKSFEVDPEEDFFLRNFGQLDFGDIGEHVESEVEAWRKEFSQLQASPNSSKPSAADGGVAIDGMGGASSDASSTVSETAAVANLLAQAPKLQEKKKCLDSHAILTRVLLKHVKQRRLDALNGIESAILRKGELDRPTFFEMLKSEQIPLLDRQRLAAIALTVLCGAGNSHGHGSGSDAEFEKEVVAALVAGGAAAGAPSSSGAPQPTAGGAAAASPASKSAEPTIATVLPAVKFLRENRTPLSAVLSGHAAAAAQSAGWRFAESLARGIARSLGRDSGDRLPVTKLVDAIIQNGLKNATAGANGRSAGGSSGVSATQTTQQIFSNFVVSDPRTKSQVDLASVKSTNVILVVVGGGAVVEQEELLLLERAVNESRRGAANGSGSGANGGGGVSTLGLGGGLPTNRSDGAVSIVYVATDMLTGDEVMRQLNQLGAE